MLRSVSRVLVVDDSALVRVALTRALRAAGLEVVERASVAASADVPAAAIRCAVLDLELDDGEGTAIAARLRAEHPAIPVAFFSSTEDEALLARARELGPVHAKPDDLAAVVAWARAPR